MNPIMMYVLALANLAGGIVAAVRWKRSEGSWLGTGLLAGLTGVLPAGIVTLTTALTSADNQSMAVLWSAPLTALLQAITLNTVWKVTEGTWWGTAKVTGYSVVLPAALMMVISAIGLSMEKYHTRQKEIAAETKANEEKEAAAKAKKAKGETAKDSKDATAKEEPEEKEPELTAEEKIWGKGSRVNKYRGDLTLSFMDHDQISPVDVAYRVEHSKHGEIVSLPDFQKAVLQVGCFGGKLTDPRPLTQAISGVYLKGRDRKVAQRILKVEVTETKVTVTFRSELDEEDIVEAQQSLSTLLYFMKTKVSGGDRMVVSPIDQKVYTIEAAPLRLVVPKVVPKKD